MPDPTSRYDWNEATGRYRDRRTGRFVTNVRGALDDGIDASADAMRQASQQLREGTISLETWRSVMQAEIKETHLASAALAKGGYAQMTQADFGRVGGIVAREYRYLERFARQIGTGEKPLDGRFLQRAEQYVKAGRETYERTRQQEAAKRGFDEERSILNPADHCEECIEEAERGFVPLGEIIPIGQRTCRKNCRCEMEYRHSVTGEVRAA